MNFLLSRFLFLFSLFLQPHKHHINGCTHHHHRHHHQEGTWSLTSSPLLFSLWYQLAFGERWDGMGWDGMKACLQWMGLFLSSFLLKVTPFKSMGKWSILFWSQRRQSPTCEMWPGFSRKIELQFCPYLIAPARKKRSGRYHFIDRKTKLSLFERMLVLKFYS